MTADCDQLKAVGLAAESYPLGYYSNGTTYATVIDPLVDSNFLGKSKIHLFLLIIIRTNGN